MTLADKVLTTENINKCQEECLNNPSFICRSFTFDSFLKTCSLSHHSRRSISGTNLVKSASNKIYEVSTCFDGKFSENCCQQSNCWPKINMIHVIFYFFRDKKKEISFFSVFPWSVYFFKKNYHNQLSDEISF